MATFAESKNKTSFVVILIALVIILVGIFLLFDFHIVRGKATSESQVSTYTFSIDEDNKLPPNQALDIYVIGSGNLEDSLAAALKETLIANPYIGTIEIRDGVPAPSPGSVLVVEITQPDMLWTPFYSRAELETQSAFASDGEVDWIDEDSVNLTSSGPVIRVRGEYQTQASAAGLMSLPGANSYLAQQIADQITASLMERLTSANVP